MYQSAYGTGTSHRVHVNGMNNATGLKRDRVGILCYAWLTVPQRRPAFTQTPQLANAYIPLSRYIRGQYSRQNNSTI